MSNAFFEVAHTLHTVEPPEIRLYYDSEGAIITREYVQKSVQEDRAYIVITQEQLDGIGKHHRVVENELVRIIPKTRHWYLEQSELSRNPYVKS
jgi:hypothetical protein